MTDPKPGLYEIPELTYHADEFIPGGSFSSTQAKQILKSPAHLRAYLDAPQVHKAAFDFGHVVHAGVLGVGLNVVILDYPNWRSKDAQDAKKKIYADGAVPMLEHEYAPAKAAIAAVKAHPIAGPLFSDDGTPELSGFGIDPDTDVWLRGRFDWTTPNHVIVDLKTTRDGSPREFGRDAHKFGYDVQEAFYRHVYELATGTPLERFIFVTVESSAPHLVDVHEGDDEWEFIGNYQMRRAIDNYKRAIDTGEWPGRPAIINELHIPPWVDIEPELEELEV